MDEAPKPLFEYDVHVFAIVRIKVPGVIAGSATEAVPAALERLGPNGLYEKFAGPDQEYAEECSHYLVDVVGDAEYRQSQWFYAAEDPLLETARWLIAWDKSGRDPAGIDPLLEQAQDVLANTI